MASWRGSCLWSPPAPRPDSRQRATHALSPPRLTRELLYPVFLPGLVFEAAFHLDFKKFWANKLAIHALAMPGLVAATDPIAVVGLFKSLGAPKRLMVLIEGESLLNDGTAVVVFTLVLAFVSGERLSAAEAGITFVRTVGGGILVGAAAGYATSKATQRIEDAMLEITLTTIAAYAQRVAVNEEHLRAMHLAHEALRREERHALARQLLLVEKDAALHSYREGAIGAEAVEEVLRDIDARLVALEDEAPGR